MRLIKRLLVIRTRWEAMFVIYALALGAITRGVDYLEQYPGWGGWVLFLACTGAVFLGGAKIMELTRPDSGARRRKADFIGARQELA